MRSGFVILVCVSLYTSCYCDVNFIIPCRQKDRKCLRESVMHAVPSVAAGIPEFGMKPLDPLHVGRVAAVQAGLTMKFENTVVKGLRNCQVLGMTRNGDNMSIKSRCSVVLLGDYLLDGKLLLMPINGEGRYKIKIQNIVVDFSFHMGRKMVGGEEYWQFDTWDFKDHVETNVRFWFHNLFKGNADLSYAIHNFANENWQAIYKELSTPIVRQVMTEIVHEMVKLFKHVPIRKLALD